MNEAYVKFDVAKLLKEKGFDWGCCSYWCIFPNGDRVHTDYGHFANHNGNETDKFVSRPTQALACRWLREEKGIHISADIYIDSSEDADGKTVDEWTYWAWDFYWLPSGNIGDEGGYDQFDSYEDAVEAALEYVLKNLI